MVRKLVTIFTVVLFVAMGFSQVAEITIEGMSPTELEELGWTSSKSTGLFNVGVGELVYLSGKDANDSTVTAWAWSIADQPGAAELDSTDTPWTTFRPDAVGTYTIQLAITTDEGTHDTTINIISGEYVGVGTMTGGAAAYPQCALCHSDVETEWAETDHAMMYTLAVDGLASDHYSENCVSCHNTGYNTDPEAVNGGFDDLATTYGWELPHPLDAGNWDSLVTNFPEVAHMANIQCESCHGPFNNHSTNPTMDQTLDEGVCGQCHESGSHHVRPTQWKYSGHAHGSEHTSSSCRKCHDGWGFIDYIDGAAELRYGEPRKTCQVCHDPHNDEIEYQLRTEADVTLGNGVVITEGGTGKLCMTCHISRRDAETYSDEYHNHYGPHHSNQTDMLTGNNAVFFGQEIPGGLHSSLLEDGCVSCHMYETPGEEEPGHNMVGDHSFNMSLDGVDNTAACQNCHGVVESLEDFMAFGDYDGDGNMESYQHELQGLLDQVAMYLPPLDETEVEVTEAYTVMQLKAAYNYEFVVDDASMGAHNMKFAVNLLLATLDTLGNATAIDDITPNMPREFTLKQNFPNPFNPMTTIEFGIPEAAQTSLIIYNSMGQKVRTLVNRNLPASYHTFQWDGRNDNGATVPSGLYIYRLVTKDRQMTRKMLFLK